MVGLRSLCLSLYLVPAAVGAGETPRGPDLLQTFATCAGRLSAQMQHQWLVSDPGADHTEAHRAAMIGLVEAAMPAGDARRVMEFRTAGRQAQAALLSRATFNANAEDAAWAAKRADIEIGWCRAFLLP